jgi:hypothetical protein
MFNLHLLQKNMTVAEYKKITPRRELLDMSDPEAVRAFVTSIRYNLSWEAFPAYIIARCPLCLAKNIEKLDTYTLRRWQGRIQHVRESSILADKLVVSHCEHFALIQLFYQLYGLMDEIYDTRFGKPPYVIGHLLESGRCQAVMHTLPLCWIENDVFVPRYNLFMISYFSKNPEKAVRDVYRFNMDWYVPEETILELPIPLGQEHWADLRHWVTKGQLYWVDGDDPELNIRTHDVKAFPYGNLTG